MPAVRFRLPREVPLRRRLAADWVFVASGHTWRHKGFHHALLALSLLQEAVAIPTGAHRHLGRADAVPAIARQIHDVLR